MTTIPPAYQGIIDSMVRLFTEHPELIATTSDEIIIAESPTDCNEEKVAA